MCLRPLLCSAVRVPGSDLAVTAGELNAGAGVGRLGFRVRAWGDVMRGLLMNPSNRILLIPGHTH